MKYKINRPYTLLGNCLTAKRKSAGMTQLDVSKKLGYSSPQFISNFERGIAAPPFKKLVILSRLYGFDAEKAVRLVMRAKTNFMINQIKSNK